MTWEIVVGLIALIGCFATIGGMVWKISAILSKLEAAVNELTHAVDLIRGENRSEHREIKEALADHEKRIVKLEVSE